MLHSLSLRHFVLVDHFTLTFESGFTVLTGETGAGKSLLMDALALLAGQRAEAGLVIEGAPRAEIEGTFLIEALPRVQAWLEEEGLSDEEGGCFIRRLIEPEGRSRAFINGRSATLAQLRALSELLLVIHGQHAHQHLMRPDTQRTLLDSYAGSTHLATDVHEAWQQWKTWSQQLEDYEHNAARLAKEIEALEWEIQLLEEATPQEKEWETLQEEQRRLAHGAELLSGINWLLNGLDESDDSILEKVDGSLNRLANLADIEPKLSDALNLMESARAELSESIGLLRHIGDRLDLDPLHLQSVEERMSTLLSVARRLRCLPEQLPEGLDQRKTQRELLSVQTDASRLKEEVEQAAKTFRALAKELSVRRLAALPGFEKAVTDHMQQLAMRGGRFNIHLVPVSGFQSGGLESVEFRVAGHAGVEPRALARVASGGELSRISLAIQVVLAELSTMPTLIFDEVDTGIGGRVADEVGRLLARLGEQSQVLCITHLPQVAGRAKTHWSISKIEQEKGVRSVLIQLNEAERIEEIGRMLGGAEVTQAIREHALALLKNH